MSNDAWLSATDLAEWLRVPAATVYRWRYHGTGPVGHRVGRHLRFRLADVEVWLDSRRDDEPARRV